MKIGLLGGSFDPPHMGHLMIANYMVEFTDIEEVWLLVSPQNPLKDCSTLSDEQLRLKMVTHATHCHPKIKPSDFEFSLSRPSYTYDTLSELSAQFPQHQFVLLVGADNINQWDRWKNHEQLLNEYAIYVYPREGQAVTLQHPNLYCIDAPRVDISSTRIREWITDRKNVCYYLPPGVEKLIKEHQLYL